MNVVRVGLGGLEFGEKTSREVSHEQPGLYVMSPEDTTISALAQQVEFHRQAADDFNRFRTPGSDPMPEQQVRAHEAQLERALGDLSMAYGEIVGFVAA